MKERLLVDPVTVSTTAGNTASLLYIGKVSWKLSDSVELFVGNVTNSSCS